MSSPVLIAGLPGKMAAEVAGLVVDSEEFDLFPTGLTGPVTDGETLDISGQSVTLIADDSRSTLALPAETLAVDYTTPSAALGNVQWYTQNDLPFVMGTTSFDLEEAKRLVAASEISAVISPNMAVPIVLLQAAGRWLAEQFPTALSGATLSVNESHQSNKLDTSGTAKAIVGTINELGVPYDVDQIEKVREPAAQLERGIPKEHLSGHAFHRYELTAAVDTVQLVLEHNVVGRRVYAEGTIAALRFLRDKIAGGSRGEVFTMEDVLRAGR